jgi:hypothetical protein
LGNKWHTKSSRRGTGMAGILFTGISDSSGLFASRPSGSSPRSGLANSNKISIRTLYWDTAQPGTWRGFGGWLRLLQLRIRVRPAGQRLRSLGRLI